MEEMNQKSRRKKKATSTEQHNQSLVNNSQGETNTHNSRIIDLDCESTSETGENSSNITKHNEELERQIVLLERRIELEEKLYETICRRKQIE